MKRRYAYSLLFAAPSLLASFAAALALLGAIAGALWLFVYGDGQWPASIGPVLTSAFGLTWAMTFAVLLHAAYRAGMRAEGEARLDRRAVILSAGTTVAALLLFAGYQWRAGNIGPQSEGGAAPSTAATRASRQAECRPGTSARRPAAASTRRGARQ